MKNAKNNEQLTAYLDGELSPSERADVERLLARDPAAREMLEELRRTSRLVASLPHGRAPAGMSDAVMARLERQALFGEASSGGTQAAPRKWTRPLALAASIGFLFVAGWIMLPQARRLGETTAPLQLADSETGKQMANRDLDKMESTPRGDSRSREPGYMGKDAPGAAGKVSRESEPPPPMALAQPAQPASREVAMLKTQLKSATDQVRESGLAERDSAGHGDGRLVGRTSRQPASDAAMRPLPTSMPTTCSAPATSQPTTRRADGG